MFRLLSPGRLVATGLVLLVVVAGILWIAPSESYILLPDRARAVAPIVSAQGERKPTPNGGIYFVDVLVRRASLLEHLIPGLRDGASVVPRHAVNPPCVSDAERRRADQREMSRSQDIAAAIALRELGYDVVVRPNGVLVSQILVGGPAVCRLRPTEAIVAVDGRPVRTVADLRRLMALREPGDRVRLTVRGEDGKRRAVALRTAPDPGDRKRALIGIRPSQDMVVRLPIRVRIDAQGVGGPSAGLAFALDVLEELGRDVDRGYRVAATGALEPDGSVVPVGGLEQKTIGARRTDIEVFLVPAGENAREARRHADGMRVVPVESFRQALRVLATLPEKQ